MISNKVLFKINCVCLIVIEFVTFVYGTDSANSHIELGNKLLAAGQLADALTHYHQAIDADPSNYMSFFRRGTVYLAMGKSKAALQDLNEVVNLKPDFVTARLQRANVLFKQGLFEDAKSDYQLIVGKFMSNFYIFN
jgi:DnaJ homolog subfamily C member 3